MPLARVVVAALVTHFLATGERLLPDVYVRCADQTLHSLRVGVGMFDSDGLGIRDDLGYRLEVIGLASELSLVS